ncbi:ABI family, member 3 (NESH) binding protein b isoform X12 [Polyodon spathula]|uniref:ABI family, member 3 (NESH) binding protein b isoform X12 n=1 Tax=Polyodon spathula TaxID=7913 RepID=UPI001B7EF279|nr:ABI family, member 3 (NESH) binding protein b isoform X12 [Polyodon spathula]
MLPRLLLLLIAGIILAGYGTSQRLPRVKRQNLKVHINATGDTIVLKFIRPRPDMKLEGFILGYGSSMFSKQYIQLPENGKPYETEVDAEPKYLIAVQPIPANDVKKQCTGQVNLQKPLHLIIGSVTPSSVLLSWGTLLKTPFEGNIMNDCLEDGHYTVRYREKERNKKWNYENCPVSDTVIDRLKPNTEYEFGVRASKGKEDGLWSKPIVHQTNAGSPDKIKGQIENPENKIIMDQLRKPEVPDITGLNNRKTIPRTRNSPRLANGDGRILPNGERRVLPNGEERILPNGARRILPNGERRVLPNGEGRVIPNGERRVLPNGERRVLPNAEGRILPNGEGRVIPNGEGHILPNGEGRVLPNGEGRILPNGEGRILPKPFNATQRHTHYRANGDGRIPLFNPNQRPKIYWANGEGRILPKSSNATQRAKIHWGKAYPFKNMTSSSAAGVPHTSPRALPTRNMPSSVKPAALPSANGETHQGQAQPRPTNTSQRTKSLWAHGEHHKGISQSKSHHFPQWPRIQLANGTQWEDNERQVHDYSEWPETKLASPLQRSPPDPSRRKQNTVVGKPGNIVKITEERQLPDKSSVLRTVLSSVTEKPAKQERKLMTAVDTRINATRMEPADNSSVFNPAPLLEVDSMGKERFIAPHVKYMMKEPDDPCSITESLRHFPEEEPSNQDITGPPKHPPSNLTVVTVEGCSSFVILDWQKVDNDSATEYEVISKSTGPSGNEESITVTNQTHTAVENLKADSSYEFTVLPKNVLGVGPSSEPVPFNTESADPRVSEYISGKDAIWTEYPFRSDSYSECNGKQFVKRTWYRKFVGVQLCNSLRYKIYLSDTLTGTFYNIGDQTGHGEDHCQFVDSFLDGRTGQQFPNDQLPQREGYYRAIRQEPVNFGEIGGKAQINYVQWYECGTTIPGKW